MRSLLSFCVIMGSYLVIAQIPNASFENWTTSVQGIEIPDGWIVNNSPGNISVIKTDDSYDGDHALLVINNGASIGGPGPGWAITNYIPTLPGNRISFYAKCDSLSGIAIGRIGVYGVNGINYWMIGYWETDTMIPEYTYYHIDTSQPFEDFGSIRIWIEAYGIQNEVGVTLGHVRLTVDALQQEFSTGLHELENTSSMSIYPNPSTGLVNLRATGRIVEVQLVNMLGQIVLDQRMGEGELVLDLRDQPAGMYLVKATNARGHRVTTKLLLERN